MREDHVQGGYLFSGPEGVGKLRAALTLAKALNCLEGSGDSCDHCDSCRKIDAGTHPDIHLIACGDDGIKIELVRSLRREMSLRPYEGRKKVFIIDNAHKLITEAANALLKVLEEPPANSVIALISDKPALLLSTVVSRCRTVKFSVLPRQELAGILRQEYALDPATAQMLSFLAEGRLGRALEMKESGMIARKNEVIDSFMGPASALDTLDCGERDEGRAYLNILAGWLRDIYMIKAGFPAQEIINSDRENDLLNCARSCTIEGLQALFDSLIEAVRNVDQNVNTKLLVYTVGEDIRYAFRSPAA